MNETLLLQKGQAFVALQPFSVLIDAELRAQSPRHCELQPPITEKILQQNGFVHGCVIGYAARQRADLCLRTLLEWAVVTSEFKINYVSEQKLGAVGQGTIARLPVNASPA